MTRRTGTILLTTALTLGGGVALAPSASAAYTDCPTTHACLWVGTTYPGAPNAKFTGSVTLASSNDRGESIANSGTSAIAYFFDADNKRGTNIRLNNPARGGQSRDPNLFNGTDATTASWADRISSASFA